jgi:hypothetical protein
MVTNGLKAQENLGWTAGLRNMLRKENSKWWNWKAIAVQLIIWTVIINSMVALAVFILPQMPVTDEMQAHSTRRATRKPRASSTSRRPAY